MRMGAVAATITPSPGRDLTVEERSGELLAVCFTAMATPCELLLPALTPAAALELGTVVAREAWRIEKKARSRCFLRREICGPMRGRSAPVATLSGCKMAWSIRDSRLGGRKSNFHNYEKKMAITNDVSGSRSGEWAGSWMESTVQP